MGRLKGSKNKIVGDSQLKAELSRVVELEAENARLRLARHESRFIHVPKPEWISLLCFVGSGLLTWAYSFVFFALWVKLEISAIFSSVEPVGELVQLGIVPAVLLAYILVGLTMVSLVACLKGGFDELKEKGLVFGLVFGLVVGLVFGLVVGLVFGLVFGLVVGLVVGLVYELVFGLVVGLVYGLVLEFSED